MEGNTCTHAWAAGLFEAEGSVTGTTNRKRWYSWYLQLQMVDEGCVRALHDLYGGTFTVRVGMTSTGRTVYRWSLSAAKAVPALEAMLPHFRSTRMRARATTALAFQASKVQHQPWLVDEYHAQQRMFFDRLRAL